MSRITRLIPLALATLCAVFSLSHVGSARADDAAGETAPAARSVSFNRDIRPILADHCFTCHGADSAARKADLRLDDRDAALEMMAIVPGDPESSEMIDRIARPVDDDMAMPPGEEHERLTEEEQQKLAEWIRAGAEYQLHWSLIPPQRADIPAIQDESWVRNPIDAFVLAKLEENSLHPAEEADRATLARRLSLDLTGLPPTPEQVHAFVNDPAPDYYERYVDQLLDSVRWGEHRGRFWLDYARYADTHGIHFDNYREIWAYRDWVIRAFNQNLPFDQFSIQQLAGDLLPNPSLEMLVATGFNRCNITTNEGGIIDEEYKVLYARDRTETTSAVWLGMTTGCAVCHDHKFDPISSRDFYSFSAFFNNTTQPVRDGNIAETPPIVPVPLSEDRDRWEALPAEIQAAGQRVAHSRSEARARYDAGAGAIDQSGILGSLSNEGLIAHVPLSSGAGGGVTWLQDGRLFQRVAAEALTWSEGHTAPAALQISETATVELPSLGDFERDSAFSVAMWVWLPGENTGGSLVARMDDGHDFRGWDVWLEGNRLASHLVHKWPENAIKVVSNAPLAKERWTHVVVSYDGSSTPEGLQFFVDGQQQTGRSVTAKSLTESMRTDVPLKIGTRHTTSRVNGVRINDLRLFSRSLQSDEATSLATATRAAYLAARQAPSRSPAEQDELFAWWVRDNAPEYQAEVAAERALVAEQAAIRERGTVALVMHEADGPATAAILSRGDYDKPGEVVPAATPAALPPMDPSLPKNRLGLARWLFDDANPLTSRVTVNRFWQEVFGIGLVETSGDFGIMGTQPTHPELLDYLAVEFRESGWDVKELFRLMVTSSTYRQSAFADQDKRAADPANRLLSRGPRYRMDAEMVRDYALFVSHQLSPKVGGPSVRPYQPIGVWEAVAMPGSNTRDYVPDSGEGLYRRSMYTFWKRSAPPASMDILNAPSRETCAVRRERTNTPLQALVTLNDPQFVEAARQLASRVITGGSDTTVRVNEIYERLLARLPADAERAVVEDSLASLAAYYRDHEEDAKALISVGQSPWNQDLDPIELATWTMLCNQMMNLDEVLNK